MSSLALVGAVAALATGCLDRNVCTSACDPKTSNVFVDQIVQTAVDKIDLLFMVDNSASMADKQDILRDAVPVLVRRLVSPNCVDGAGKPTGESSSTGTCMRGGLPEFNPIGDIHIGIVSSSLGSHGGQVCTGPRVSAHANDNGHLLGTVRTDAFPLNKTWNKSGFLAWDPSGTRNNPPGTGGPTGAADLQATFQDMIVAAGEDGCGFEAQLESWYRFLIDPEPPALVGLDATKSFTVRNSALTIDPATQKPKLDAMGNAVCVGCDETLLAERKAFLRPDSLLAIVMLSDENDCSIRDDGVGWFVGTTTKLVNGVAVPVYMPRATSQCAANANDPCCRSCAQLETTPPKDASGNLCPALSADPVCKSTPTWAPPSNGPPNYQDSTNLRCYNQKQRFGFDLLYETSRYVDGLTHPTLPLQSNPNVSVTNPLFDAAGTNKAPRDPSLVFLAGIVGVPWQDVADDASLTGAGLNYLTASELEAKGRWAALLGDPSASPPVPPSDPLMIESVDARKGTNTIAVPAVAIAPATSTDPHANAINGHEYNIPQRDDLQYACTFPLAKTKTCVAGDNACDCSPTATTSNSPLCQGGATINTQTSAKAYPGTRELQVLKDLGENAIVASICPKQATGDPTSDPNYGYNPAVGAIIERLKVALNGKCLPRPIQTNDKGQLLCRVMEAQKSACDCSLPGRLPPDPLIESAVQAQLQATGNCGNAGQASCKSWCQCEIKQETGADLSRCQSNDAALKTPGYCYVDKTAEKAPGANTAAIGTALAKCPANQQQLLRFVDADSEHQTPAQ
ncbi:MAG TPA: hypothetical protein VGL19_13995, partial [Polyangiaceae bacterium]